MSAPQACIMVHIMTDNIASSSISHNHDALARAMAFAQANYGDKTLATGELILTHAQGMSEILKRLGVGEDMHVSAFLFAYLSLSKTAAERKALHEKLSTDWGEAQAVRIANLDALMSIGVKIKVAKSDVEPEKKDKRGTSEDIAEQVERVRKMLLAMAHDIRVVILRLVSRLQTLRYFAAHKVACPPELAKETLLLYSPLANRLGVWQVKWELEDLAFRFAEPSTYREISKWLDEKRIEREGFIEQSIGRLQAALKEQNVTANISGRPKHIYSIYNKMRGKELQFADLYDIRAFRIIVEDLKDCYSVLGVLHHLWQPIPKEFDDYIARPNPNGYQSLHTVVVGDDGRPIEVQIRTKEMHQFAEYGVAAHWRYKEGGFAKGVSSEQSDYDAQIAWVRQLISWQSDLTHTLTAQDKALKLSDPHIYVLTPDARVVELQRDATPIDFAYHVHTNLGHLCRGAKVNGQMVPLNTKLHTGQTVAITAAKQGGPSRDWLREDFVKSPRAKSKIRAWFNAQATADYVAQGRALFEKELQRLGKTAARHEEVARALGFDNANDCYLAVGREEISGHHVEEYFKAEAPVDTRNPASDDKQWISAQTGKSLGKGGVLVVGLDDLMTQLAQCCKPAPPDEISGFVTRGKGLSIPRASCDNFAHMKTMHPERVLPCAWASRAGSRYAVDVLIHAHESMDLMKDITDILAREKVLISGLTKQRSAASCQLVFSLEVEHTDQLEKAMQALRQLPDVSSVERL